ncbi:MAG: hypothetical protein ACXWMX_05410, partial [Candidatus Limnocylindrales bacterium]
PALVEAAAGVRSAAASAGQLRAELARHRGHDVAFGSSAHAFAGFVVAWEDELDRLGRAAGEIALAVEAAAADYLLTDARAAGAGP